MTVGRSLKITDTDYNVSALFRVFGYVMNFFSGEVDLVLSDLYKIKQKSVLTKLKKDVESLNTIKETLKLDSVEVKRTTPITTGELENNLLLPDDKKLNTEIIRQESIDPLHISFDAGTPQFSIQDAIVEILEDPNDVKINVGQIICHNYNALDRKSISKLQEGSQEYQPQRVWSIAEQTIPLSDNDGYFLYIEVPMDF